jgi:hypothetical protein
MARPTYTHLTSFTGVRPSVNRWARTDAPIAMYRARQGFTQPTTSAGALVARYARC